MVYLLLFSVVPSLPVVEVIVPKNMTVLEGSTVTFSVKVNATPPVNATNILWLFKQFGALSSLDITTSSLLGDGQTQLELSSGRLSLTLRNVSRQSSGVYTITATNVAGTSRNFFAITVQSKLFI